jgi:hypothetical protein
MSISAVTRRTALVSLGALSVFSRDAPRRAAAQATVRFRDIRVDVWRLRGSDGDQTADWMEEELPRDLAKALAPYMAPAGRNGAILLARIDNVDLGVAGGARGSGGVLDTIEGVLMVSGPRGALAAQTPLRAVASYGPSAIDQPLFEDAYHGRVAALAEAFAGSAPRRLGI